MREQLQALADKLGRLHESGNVRPDGEQLLSVIRVEIGQLMDTAGTEAQAAEAAKPDPVDVRLDALAAKVDLIAEDFAGVSDLVNQLAKLAGDLQAATVKGA